MKLAFGALLTLVAVVSSSSNGADKRHLDLLRASGLGDLPVAVGKSKYDNHQNTRPTFPSTTKGTFFAGVLTDHAVLQREPAKAAVYGVVFGANLATNVTVEISEVDEENISKSQYTVMAAVHVGEKGYATWKAFLHPTSAGGNFTITASCSSCEAPMNSSTLADVTFGDVWVR
jgi:hypothetical protein